MLEGMRADFDEVDRISTQVWQMASAAREIRATNPAGTDIVGRFSPNMKWLKTSGIISPNKWGNLPGGEIFTCPERVDGRFVIDGVVGDYLCEKYGDLGATPLTIDSRESRLTEAHAPTRNWKPSSGATATPTRTATAWANSPSAPTSRCTT